MAKVTFQVVEGVDKGRIFRDLPTPVTIGREEGNLLRLNDERVSRFHAKVQQDDDDIILTDLQSTNGTRVNGVVVQIRRLRYGDRVLVGRSLLLFGSNEQIAERMSQFDEQTRKSMSHEPMVGQQVEEGPATVQSKTFAGPVEDNLDFDLNVDNQKVTITNDAFFIGTRPLPPLPLKMTPSQAARFSEILDFLHHGLINATDNIQAKEDGTEVTLNYTEWQRIQAVQMILARYIRAISEPETLQE
jgi:pSer/pThr/pTyr-binding forkhead associated (FHA) protein